MSKVICVECMRNSEQREDGWKAVPISGYVLMWGPCWPASEESWYWARSKAVSKPTGHLTFWVTGKFKSLYFLQVPVCIDRLVFWEQGRVNWSQWWGFTSPTERQAQSASTLLGKMVASSILLTKMHGHIYNSVVLFAWFWVWSAAQRNRQISSSFSFSLDSGSHVAQDGIQTM